MVFLVQVLEKLNRELKDEDEEELIPVDISLFPDSIFKGFQADFFLLLSLANFLYSSVP